MSDVENASYGGKAAKGGIATIAGQLLRTIIQLVSIVVLSRLLLPEDYGLLAMVLVVVGIGEMVRDFGLSTASVQAKELSETQRNTMFWANTLIGAVLTIIGIALAVPVAAFYSNSDLVDLMRVVSFTFVINGVAAQFKAHLVRDFRFVANTATDIIGQLSGLFVAIAVASTGGGFWALAAQQIVQGSVSLFCLVLTAKWLPGLSVRLTESRSLFKFGWNYTATNLLVYFSTNVSTVILGKLFSPAELGLYNRAFQLANMPYSQVSAPIGNVAIPILSRVQREREVFARLLLRGQTAVSNLMVGGYCFAIGVMVPAVDVAFGNEWGELAPLLQILAIGSMSQTLMFSSYWAFVSLGLTGSNLRFALVTRPILLLFVAGGSFFGPYGAAWAMSIGLVLMWPAALLWLRRFHQIKVGALFWSALRIVAMYSLCGFVAWFTASLTPNSWLALLGGALSFFITLAACLFTVPPFRREFADVVLVLRRRGR